MEAQQMLFEAMSLIEEDLRIDSEMMQAGGGEKMLPDEVVNRLGEKRCQYLIRAHALLATYRATIGATTN